MIAYTALRISELFGLPADLVEPENRVLSVRDTVTESGGRRTFKQGRGKSEAALRHLAVVDQAMPAIRRLEAIRLRGLALEPGREARRAARAAAGKGNKRGPNRPVEDRWLLLVAGEQGGFMSYGAWRKRLAVAKAASGVDYDAHSLRHVAVSILYAAGESEEAIAEQVGHADPKTSRSVYRHVFKVDRIEMARRVSEKQALLTAAELAAAEAEAIAENAPTLRALGELED